MPILILTARDGMADKIKNFEVGADDYLTKPRVAFAELLGAMSRRCCVAARSIAPSLCCGSGTSRWTVFPNRSGSAPVEKIELTAKEYSLLEYLATHPDRVFSRTMIIEHVWDQSFEGLTNIVDVYVRHLRAKVDDPFPTKLLRTPSAVWVTA